MLFYNEYMDISRLKVLINSFFSNPSWDMILFLVLIAAGFFYGITAGRRKIISSIIYTYVAFAVLLVLPIDKLQKILQIKDPGYIKIGIFSVLFVLLIFILGRAGGRAFASSNPWWQVAALSAAQAGLFMHIILGFLTQAQIKNLSPFMLKFIEGADMRLWWFAGPLALLALIRVFELREESRW